jgi:hypothetical protein
MKFLRTLFCICFISLYGISSAQYYNTGQDPASLKWMQIKTGRFTVIYPKSYGDAGIDFARSLDNAYSKLVSLYPEKKFRIPVVIHNYTTQSNGYVAWAPSRMEIYPTPVQNSIPLDPNTQLAIHELTHVLQMESLNRGFTKAMSYIAGQQFTGIVSSLLPLWFLEGDAVFSESVLTGSGRGRVPSFQKQLKAMMIEKESVYKYDKIVNGSFRDFVPDHYQYGYQMAAWSYARYNPDMWKKALNLTAGAPFLINPVNLSLRKSASLTKKRLFRETFDTLKTLWTATDIGSGSESYEILNPPKGKNYVNYYSPVLAGNDSIIAVKTSLTDPPSFVLIRPSEKSEEKIHIPGYGFPWFISYGKGKLVWVETHSDPRWENRNWSVIKVMDIQERTIRQLTGKTRYMSASVSPDGNYIAAIENTIDNRNNLQILDAWNGFKLHAVQAPGNASLQRPQWDASGKTLSVIYLTEQGEGILKFSLTDKTWHTLIEAGNDDIQSTYLRNDSLFFVSSHSGTDNIYLCKPDKSVVPLTKSRFGISDLNLSGYLLLFSDYSSSGNNISYTTLPTVSVKSEIKNQESSYLINRFKPVPSASKLYNDKIYTPVPYRKWQNLFRFHSWMPFYADIEKIQDDPTSITPGFTLMSQNNLSTMISSFGYEYSDQRHKFHAGIKWLGWYPVFESRIDYGNSIYVEKFRENVSDPADIINGYEWTNTLSLPLSFQGGRFTKYLYLSASSSVRNDYIYLKTRGIYDNLQNQLTGRVYFSNYQRSAIRDIYPKWAQILDVSYSDYPFDSEIYGDLLTAKTAFYFPGFMKNHGFKLKLEAEKQNPEKFVLGNRASFARGYIGIRTWYDETFYENIISQELQTGSFDYFMPLAYPDFNLAGFLYMTRIRTDFFYDFTRGTNNYVFVSDINSRGIREVTMAKHDYTETFRSFGVQLMADYYVFRMPFMISSGIEASWRTLGDYPYVRLIFNIDIFGMNIGKNRFSNRGAI